MLFLLGIKLKVVVAASWGSLTVKISLEIQDSGWGMVEDICGRCTRKLKALIYIS